MFVAMIDWTSVIVAGIAAVGSLGSAGIGYLVLVQLRTPSGDNLGAVAERTHDITHATNVLVRRTMGERKTDNMPTPADHHRKGDNE